MTSDIVKTPTPVVRITTAQAKLRWKSASSLRELCELNAQFIEGRSPFIPGYCSDSIAEETLPIATQLASISRLGLLTTCSQPGLLGEDQEQRAFVDGFASEKSAGQILRASRDKRLFVQIYPPYTIEGDGDRINVTRYLNKVEYTWTGDCSFEYEFHCFGPHCSPLAMNVLRSSWYVSVIDPKWHRNGLLWTTVEEALKQTR